MSKENCWLGLLQNVANGLKPDAVSLAAPVDGTAKRGRGRPRGTKRDGALTLIRILLIIEGFQKFRLQGYNRIESMRKTAKHINDLYPDMRGITVSTRRKVVRGISVSAVRKVLAIYHTPRVNFYITEGRDESCGTAQKATDPRNTKHPNGHQPQATCLVVERKLEEVPVWEDMTLGAVIDKFETMEVLQFSLRPFPKYPKIKRTALKYSKKFR